MPPKKKLRTKPASDQPSIKVCLLEQINRPCSNTMETGNKNSKIQKLADNKQIEIVESSKIKNKNDEGVHTGEEGCFSRANAKLLDDEVNTMTNSKHSNNNSRDNEGELLDVPNKAVACTSSERPMLSTNVSDTASIFSILSAKDSTSDSDADMFPELDTQDDIEGFHNAASQITTVEEQSVQLSDLRTSWSHPPKLPHLSGSSKTHKVLIKLPLSAKMDPYPASYVDKWEEEGYVKMPCSPLNVYPLKERNKEVMMRKRWELIRIELLKKMESADDIQKAILAYNRRFQNKWKFNVLHVFIHKRLSAEDRKSFFDVVLPSMKELALALPDVCTQPIPLLPQNSDKAITLSQHQAACLLANAFFCTFPRRNPVKYSSSERNEYSLYPSINFNQLYTGGSGGAHRKFAKLHCLFNYFRRVTSEMPQGLITFRRQSVERTVSFEDSRVQLTNLYVSSRGFIENEGEGMLQVDFANKYLGGGVLNYGCVQEEIRFMLCPEMLLSCLVTECLKPLESLVMIGCERFNNYTGYAATFQWDGDHRDPTPRDEWMQLKTEVVAIDAIVVRHYKEQFQENLLKRELLKSLSGFQSFLEPANAVATGNWGCGAFGGDLQIKALIQILAASMSGRDVAYFTFGNEKLQQQIFKMHQSLVKNNLTVGDIYGQLIQFSGKILRPRYKKSLFQYLHDACTGMETDETDESVVDIDEDSNEGRTRVDESSDFAANTP